MIIDHIRNRHLYYGLGEDFKAALDFFASYHDDNPVEADIPVPGSNVLVRVRPCMTKPAAQCPFEAHRLYADIHFVAAGVEAIGYQDKANMVDGEYDAVSDASLLEGAGPLLTLKEGYFMVTLPDDAHQPCVCAGEEPCKITKLIAKIKVK